MTASCELRIRLTPDERAQLDRAAAIDERPVSDYVRAVALAAAAALPDER